MTSLSTDPVWPHALTPHLANLEAAVLAELGAHNVRRIAATITAQPALAITIWPRPAADPGHLETEARAAIAELLDLAGITAPIDVTIAVLAALT